jgi:hypothetical protein
MVRVILLYQVLFTVNVLPKEGVRADVGNTQVNPLCESPLMPYVEGSACLGYAETLGSTHFTLMTIFVAGNQIVELKNTLAKSRAQYMGEELSQHINAGRRRTLNVEPFK